MMGFMGSLRELEYSTGRESDLELEIARLRLFNSQLKTQVDGLVESVCDLEQRVGELQVELAISEGRKVPDLSRDPDPYGLHGYSLSHRLHEIGFPE
jgi:predicted nuclease with TOPRIM domain